MRCVWHIKIVKSSPFAPMGFISLLQAVITCPS